MEFLILIMSLSMFMLVLVGVYGGLWLFAKVTYKLAHKNTHKGVQNRRGQNKTEIIYDLGDTKNMTLQEIQLEKTQMRKILGGI